MTAATLAHPTTTLPADLTVGWIDSWLSAARQSPTARIHLGHKGCKAGPAAAAHLQAAIGVLKRSGTSVELTLPPGTFSTDPALLLDSAEAAEGATEAEKCLLFSIEGLVLGQLCERVGPGPDTAALRAAQSAALRRRGNVYGRGRGQALAIITAEDARVRLADNVISRRRVLESRLETLIRSHQKTTDPRTAPWFDQVATYATEATENTFDHGRLALDGNPIPSVRFLSVTRHRSVELARSSDGPTGELVGQYLFRLEALCSRERIDFRQQRLLAVTVADGGVGIPASIAHYMDVYDGDVQFEYKQLLEAFAYGTSKPVGEPGTGLGLKKMLRACHRVRGLLLHTTGRHQIGRTYLEPSGTSESPDFNDPHGKAFRLDGYVRERQLVAGTAATLLFPMDRALAALDPAGTSRCG